MRHTFGLVLACLAVFSGCATTLSKKGSRVILIDEDQHNRLKACRYIQTVLAWGKNEQELPELKILLRNQAGAHRANVVMSSFKLVEPDYLTYGNTNLKQLFGTAYYCPKKDLENLQPETTLGLN